MAEVKNERQVPGDGLAAMLLESVQTFESV